MTEWEFKEDVKEADNNGNIFISLKKNPWIQSLNLNESHSTINEDYFMFR